VETYLFAFSPLAQGMYICSQSGELVHPIHLQHLVEEEAALSEQNEPHATLERGQPVHNG
jgi:hypothetical protein